MAERPTSPVTKPQDDWEDVDNWETLPPGGADVKTRANDPKGNQGFWGTVADSIGQAIPRAIHDPLGTAAGMVHSVLPQTYDVKPQSQEFNKDIDTGNYGRPFAHAVLGAAPILLGAAGKGIQAGADWLRGVDPDTSLFQSVPFRVSGEDFMQRSPVLRGDVKLAAGNQPITDVPSAKNAVGAAKAINRAVFDMHIAPYRAHGIQIPLDPIADEMLQSIPTKLRLEARTDPTAAQQLQAMEAYANSYRRQAVDIDTFRKMAEETNGELNGFYHKTADAQNAALAQRGGTAMLEAQARAQRAIMQRMFGPDAADIQRRWGYLDDFDAALDAGYRKMLNEKPSSNASQAKRIASVPGKLFHGDVEGGLNSLKGKTNNLIKQTFDNTAPGLPLPTPQPGQGVGGIPTAIPPSRQLPPATPRLGAQSPTGSVRSTGTPPGPQVNAWQGIGARRQLPAGSAPFTQGTSVPDVLGRPDLRTPYNAGRLPAANPNTPSGTYTAPMPGDVLPGDPQSYIPEKTANGAPPTPKPPTVDWRRAQGQPSYGQVIDAHPSTDSIAVQMGKKIWDAIKPQTPGGNQ